VRLRHALPNALLPLLALFGSRVGALVGGALVVETAFALPGLGRLAVTAAIARDQPTVIGVVLVAALAIVLANLAVDLLQLWLDPRQREAS
jgi:peptide/nickel transport system permease protein